MGFEDLGIAMIGAGVFSLTIILTEKITPDPAWLTQAGMIAMMLSFLAFTLTGLILFWSFRGATNDG